MPLSRNQKIAAESVEGPLLITAGPGTGKTFTIINRLKYLLKEKHVDPGSIMMITFTRKAAKELVTRVSNELSRELPDINIEEMYIGNFHQVFLKMLNENLDSTGLEKNFRHIDDFEQSLLIYDNVSYKEKIYDENGHYDLVSAGFLALPNFAATEFYGEDNCGKGPKGRPIGKWSVALRIAALVNTLREELISTEEMYASEDSVVVAAAEILDEYKRLCSKKNVLDFSGMLYEAYELLTNEPEVLEKLRSEIKYIMVDEYQDTNYIQEQLMLLLAGDEKNICVVGDDDQSLYRFRGATVSNILGFADRFGENGCKTVNLDENRRSAKDIIDFYVKWMREPVGFSWNWTDTDGSVRCDRIADKRLDPIGENDISDVRVVTCFSEDEYDFAGKMLYMINKLQESGAVTNLNQIAFLTKATVAGSLGSPYEETMFFLEDEGDIPIYAPRFKFFFKRTEMKELIGCLLRLFPDYAYKITYFVDDENSDKSLNPYIGKDVLKYYKDCLTSFDNMLNRLGNTEKIAISGWMERMSSVISSGDYIFAELIYRIIAFEPFRSYVDSTTSDRLIDQRSARNTALLIQYVAKYEIARKGNFMYDRDRAKDFFSFFLSYLTKTNIEEFIDESEYAPDGCVSFMTIHQSKGLEFPVVIVDAMKMSKRGGDPIYEHLKDADLYKRTFTENDSNTDFYDFYRLYYTAYSRAQSLLILSYRKELMADNEENEFPELTAANKQPDPFIDMYKTLPNFDSIDLSTIPPKEVKPVEIKDSYSFTSHVAAYQSCPRQYLFFKEFGYTPMKNSAMFFGSLVHETIEDVHRAVLAGESDKVTEDNIETWFENNLRTLSQKENLMIRPEQRSSALAHVKRYVERCRDNFDRIFAVEEEVTLVLPQYIISGKIDLIRGDGDNCEIVDFKSEKKDDIENNPLRFDRYRRQLQVYTRILKESRGYNVTKAHLYCTGEQDDMPEIEINISAEAVDTAFTEFSGAIDSIREGNFPPEPADASICRNCDLRFFCKKESP